MNNKHRETDHSAGRDFLSLDVEILKSTLSSVGIESIRDQHQHSTCHSIFRISASRWTSLIVGLLLVYLTQWLAVFCLLILLIVSLKLSGYISRKFGLNLVEENTIDYYPLR